MKLAAFYENVLVPTAQITTLFVTQVLSPADRHSKIFGCHLQEAVNNLAFLALGASEDYLDLMAQRLTDGLYELREQVSLRDIKERAALQKALAFPKERHQVSLYRLRRECVAALRAPSRASNVAGALMGLLHKMHEVVGLLGATKSSHEWVDKALTSLPERRQVADVLMSYYKPSPEISRWRTFEHNFERQTAGLLLGLPLSQAHTGKHYVLARMRWQEAFEKGILAATSAENETSELFPPYVQLSLAPSLKMRITARDAGLVYESLVKEVCEVCGADSAEHKKALELRNDYGLERDASISEIANVIHAVKVWHATRREELDKLLSAVHSKQKSAKVESEILALRERFTEDELQHMAKILAQPKKPVRTRKKAA